MKKDAKNKSAFDQDSSIEDKYWQAEYDLTESLGGLHISLKNFMDVSKKIFNATYDTDSRAD